MQSNSDSKYCLKIAPAVNCKPESGRFQVVPLSIIEHLSDFYQ